MLLQHCKIPDYMELLKQINLDELSIISNDGDRSDLEGWRKKKKIGTEVIVKIKNIEDP